MVPTLKEVKLLAYSDGVGTAIGFAHLYPEQIDGLLLFAGYNNSSTARYAELQAGGSPVRYERPIRTVGIASPRDTEFFSEIRTACNWFAAANGFAANPATNSVKRDYNRFVNGVDSTVVEMGEHVRFIISDASDHSSSMFNSPNGTRVLFGRFLKEGMMPGSEGE